MNLKKLIQRGQTGLGGYIGVVVTLFVLVLMLFAFTLAAAELNDTIELQNNSTTVSHAVVNDGVAGMASFAGLLPAIFIVAAIGVLLLVLLGAVGVFLRR